MLRPFVFFRISIKNRAISPLLTLFLRSGAFMTEENVNISSETKTEKDSLKREKLKRRITEIDFIRGIAIIIMVLDHAMYDLGYLLADMFKDYPYKLDFTASIYKFARTFWNWQVRIDVRYFILFLFLALTGISCSFSRNNFKRGIKLFAVAMFLTLVTFVFGKMINDRDLTIVFGILHCISVTILLISAIEFITENLPFDNKWIYLGLGVILTATGAYVSFVNPKVQPASYGQEPFITLFLKTVVGIYEVGSDNYSLLFYGGQIFLGVFLGKWLYKDRKSLIVKGDYKNNFITFAGRHSLLVYIAHQVILPLLFSIILLCLGFKLSF